MFYKPVFPLLKSTQICSHHEKEGPVSTLSPEKGERNRKNH